MEKAMIVTDRSMVNLGYVEKIEDVIRRRRNHVDIELFFDVEPDPSIDTVREGVELMRKFEPDCIIALGGGSSMDAAKVMWLMYENPEVNFDDIKQKFMDIRKRAFKFPVSQLHQELDQKLLLSQLSLIRKKTKNIH